MVAYFFVYLGMFYCKTVAACNHWSRGTLEALILECLRFPFLSARGCYWAVVGLASFQSPQLNVGVQGSEFPFFEFSYPLKLKFLLTRFFFFFFFGFVLTLKLYFRYDSSLVAQMEKCLPAMRETRVQSLVGKIPWRRKWQPTPVFLPGESHRQRSLGAISFSVHGVTKSRTWLSDFTFSISVMLLVN